ncbi:MAG TPA: hypothetical protein VIF09_10750 [Polyangiaceae bacterium]|jgi:hypothetical protein
MNATDSSGSSEWALSTRDGGCHFRWRRQHGDVLAEWVGILTLRVDRAGDVSHAAAPGADPLVVHKLIHTGAAAFVRALRGQPSLHGSAVMRSGAALVCLGDKGAGKSTAASELCRVHGFALLADDVVALEPSGSRWLVSPTESAHWLLSGDGTRKGPVPATSSAGSPAEVRSLVALRLDDGVGAPRLTRLRGAEAYSTLSAALLRFEAADALRVGELDVLASVAAGAPVHELARPRAFSPRETARLLLQLMGDES